MSPPAACCGATRRCGVRSRSGPCASPSASGSAGRGWRWHANSRSCCTPCGATARSSSGGGLRHRHQPKTRRHRPDFLRAYAVLSGTAVRSPVREGRGGTRARLPAWRARLLRATPTTRMAPSRSNFPILRRSPASNHEENAVASGRRLEFKDGRHLSVSFRTSSQQPEIVVRSVAAPSAHRYAAVGLDGSARPNKEASVPWSKYLANCPMAGVAAAAIAHLTGCRNERRRDRAVTPFTVA